MHRMRVQHGALLVPSGQRRADYVEVSGAVADVLAEAVVVVAVEVDEELLVVEGGEYVGVGGLVGAEYVGGMVVVVVRVVGGGGVEGGAGEEVDEAGGGGGGDEGRVGGGLQGGRGRLEALEDLVEGAVGEGWGGRRRRLRLLLRRWLAGR